MQTSEDLFQQYDEGIHLLLETKRAALHCIVSKTLMLWQYDHEDAKQDRHRADNASVSSII